MNIWKGTLTLRQDRNKEGAEVTARIISATSALLEISDSQDAAGKPVWRAGDVNDIHPQSLLRALAATGPEVG